jgi:hypothetical protein
VTSHTLPQSPWRPGTRTPGHLSGSRPPTRSRKPSPPLSADFGIRRLCEAIAEACPGEAANRRVHTWKPHLHNLGRDVTGSPPASQRNPMVAVYHVVLACHLIDINHRKVTARILGWGGVVCS